MSVLAICLLEMEKGEGRLVNRAEGRRTSAARETTKREIEGGGGERRIHACTAASMCLFRMSLLGAGPLLRGCR